MAGCYPGDGCRKRYLAAPHPRGTLSQAWLFAHATRHSRLVVPCNSPVQPSTQAAGQSRRAGAGFLNHCCLDLSWIRQQRTPPSWTAVRKLCFGCFLRK